MRKLKIPKTDIAKGAKAGAGGNKTKALSAVLRAKADNQKKKDPYVKPGSKPESINEKIKRDKADSKDTYKKIGHGMTKAQVRNKLDDNEKRRKSKANAVRNQRLQTKGSGKFSKPLKSN